MNIVGLQIHVFMEFNASFCLVSKKTFKKVEAMRTLYRKKFSTEHSLLTMALNGQAASQYRHGEEPAWTLLINDLA
ncbi:Trimethylamine-N-oxide reductase [Trichinella pseudospiralis]